MWLSCAVGATSGQKNMAKATEHQELGKPPLPREANANFDECILVFHALNAAQRPGVMIDVGAHTGSSLVPYAQAGWTVFAFEPDPANRIKLDTVMRANPSQFKHVTVSDKAVSDRVEDGVAFFASDESTGISSLSAFRDTHQEVAQISTTTLDTVREDHGIDHIDFLKIDVEGHEMAVLKGLDFGAVRPRAIVAEFENSKTASQGFNSRDLAEFFASRNYTVFVSEWHPIIRYGMRHSWRWMRRWPCDIPDSAWGNLVAFAEPPEERCLANAMAHAFEQGGKKRGPLSRLARSIRKRFLASI